MDIKGPPWYYGGMWERLRETQIVVERDRVAEGERDRELNTSYLQTTHDMELSPKISLPCHNCHNIITRSLNELYSHWFMKTYLSNYCVSSAVFKFSGGLSAQHINIKKAVILLKLVRFFFWVPIQAEVCNLS